MPIWIQVIPTIDSAQLQVPLGVSHHFVPLGSCCPKDSFLGGPMRLGAAVGAVNREALNAGLLDGLLGVAGMITLW